jgi:hypothetical protein
VRRVAALLLLAASPAAADRVASLRVGGAAGVLDELTWAAPEIDVAATFDLGERAFVVGMIGYTLLDNHTYLADARAIRFAIAGGVRVVERVRAAATLGLELVAFHPDPDVLDEHPDVDVIARFNATLPSAGIEVSRPLSRTAAVGVYARIALRELTLFDTPSGDTERARLVLAGAYLELAIR